MATLRESCVWFRTTEPTEIGAANLMDRILPNETKPVQRSLLAFYSHRATGSCNPPTHFHQAYSS